MDLTDRFFGKGTPRLGGPAVANPRLLDPPTFQLLFPDRLDLDADALTLALRDYHPELAAATAELQTMPSAAGSTSPAPALVGLLGWGRHVVKLVGYDSPLARESVEGCVGPSVYEPELKAAAYQHTAHVVLFYAGYEHDSLEQHVALAAASAALARFGAIVAINPTAHVSVPAMTFLPHEEDEGDMLIAMRSLPLPYIYAGLVKLEVEETPGLWMRTYGCHAFQLPDLAILTEGHQWYRRVFVLFTHMLDYLRKSGKTFASGDEMGLSNQEFYRFRSRTPEEWFLESPGEMLVVERMEQETGQRGT